MNGWQTKKLGDVAMVGSGNSAPQDESFFEDGTVPFFRTADAGRIRFGSIFEATDNLNDKGAKGLRRFKKGTILFPKSGASTFLNHRVMLEVEGCVSSHLATIVANEKRADSKFLLYFLSTVATQDLVQDHAYPSLSLPTIAGIDVHLPPLPEQQRIVGVLDEVFSRLATAQAHAKKNLENARELFESHLQSVLSPRGKGWVEKSVSELVEEKVLSKPFDGNHGEIHPKKSDYTKSGVPFVMACDLENGRVDTINCKFISKKLADSLRVGFAKDGDVLISHKGTIGRSAIVSTTNDYIMLTPQLTSYRVNDKDRLFNRFVRYYFMSPIFQSEIIKRAEGGATRAYIGITKQLTLRLRFPGIDEQRKITEKLDALAPQTHRLENLYKQKQAALAALKKSLLYQAFIGEL
jgi:type I restriction enzyme S subunit